MQPQVAHDPSAGGTPSTVYDQNGKHLVATPGQAKAALNANGLNVNGSGIKVGVISDSYNNQGDAAQDIRQGWLPPGSKIQIIHDFPSGGTDEGRAMMEVVHDVAPGASLAFCTSSGTAADFANGIQNSDTAFAHAILALAQAGCKVICDDIAVPDLPWFQGGIIDAAIQQFEAQGGTYLTCADNSRQGTSPTSKAINDPAYQSTWKRTSVTLNFNGQQFTYNDALNFGNGGFQNVRLTPGAAARFEMEWDQPWGNATSDLALVVSFNGQVVMSSSGNFAVYRRGQNQTPTGESVDLTRCPLVDTNFALDPELRKLQDGFSTPITLQVSIINLGGADPSLVKYIIPNNGGPRGAFIIDGENAGTAVGFKEDPFAITVGAVDSGNTPAFGNKTPLSEPFTAGGQNVEWVYNINGTRLTTPQLLNVVDIMGIDDIKTGVTDDGLDDFYGTSCATPSVAGVAALMLQGNRALTQPDVQNLLQDSAVPMAIGSAVAGAGLANAKLAVEFAETLRLEAQSSNYLVYGTHLNDLLVATHTNDVLAGWTGDDTYYVTSTTDKVVENSAEGIDTVRSTVNWSIYKEQYVENLSLVGTAAINGTGNNFANHITGNAAANVINGAGGNDALAGGKGADSFVFKTGYGADKITDFAAGSAAGHDFVDVDKRLFANYSELMQHTTNSGANCVITANAHDRITLDNVHRANLVAADFKFI